MGGTGELHGLNQLRGNLGIHGLGNLRDARDAKEAKLKDKSELQSLTLGWGYLNQTSVEEQVVILGNLQPHPNLTELVIWGYEGVTMPHWMIRSSLLPNLVQLHLSHCSNFKYLPLIGEFPCLKCLYLRNLEALEFIHNKVVARGNKGEGNPLVLFPLLEQLTLHVLENIKRWTISVEATRMRALTDEEEDDEKEEAVATDEEGEAQHSHLHLLSSMFPRLTQLCLSDCHNLTTLPMLSVGGIRHLTSLRKLHFESLDRLVSLPDCPAPATLEELHITSCSSLMRLPDCFLDNLNLLSVFNIQSCPELTTLPEGLGRLSSLEELEIWDCSNLSSLPQGIQHLTALKRLKIHECPALKMFPEDLGSP